MTIIMCVLLGGIVVTGVALMCLPAEYDPDARHHDEWWE